MNRAAANYLAHTPYLACREDGHAWHRPDAYWDLKGDGRRTHYTKTLECLKCGTHRYDTVDSRFRFVRRHYHYADGYTAPGAHITRAEVRRYDIEHNTLGTRP